MPSLAEIEQLAFALQPSQRASLASRLIATLPDPDYDVSDDEVMQRDRELESGIVQPMTHDEFVRAVNADRGR